VKTILAPVDFSLNSSHAAEFLQCWPKDGAKLHLLNVVLKFDYYVAADPMFYTPPATLLIENTDEKLRKHSLKNLDSFSRRKIFKGLKVTSESRTSVSIHDEIINYASEIKADVVVIGSKGASKQKYTAGKQR
jgi:nucleotide-binding universal stress UspA family protein